MKKRRVFLIPGNHDINNKDSYNYNLGGKGIAEPTPTVTPPEFMDLYSDLVFDHAFSLYKDSKHFKGYLSKVNASFKRDAKFQDYAHGYTSYASRVDLNKSKPGFNGLTIIGLDTVKYSIDQVMEKKDGCQNTDGIVTIEQLRWIVDVCEMAKKRNDIVMVLAHHAFIPHFNNQEKALAPYIIDNHRSILHDEDQRIDGKTPVDVLADLGIKFIFTGHMHAQDIAKKISTNGNAIYDIETGSTVTYPLPVRHLEVENKISSYNPRVVMKVSTDRINEFQFTGPEGKDFIRVHDALEHASQNLITADLIEGLVGEYVLPNFKYDARGLINFVSPVKLDDIDYFDYVCENYLPEILEPDTNMVLRKKRTYTLLLSLEKPFNKNKKNNSFIMTVKSLGQKFSYRISKVDFNAFTEAILDQVDSNIIKNTRLILSWTKRLSDEFLKFKLSNNGNIRTISDYANEAYLTHLLGDEKASEDFMKLHEEIKHRNIIKESIIFMRKDIQRALDDMISHIRYDGLIERFVVRITKNNSFFGGAVDKRIYKFFGSSIYVLLKSMKIKSKKIFELIMSFEKIEELTKWQSDELMNLAHALSTETQPEYKDFAYFEDNNTYIEESLVAYKRNDQALDELERDCPSSSDNALKALMYVDILAIGALLLVYMSKKNKR